MTATPAYPARYSSVAIAFHWTIAALVVANLAIGIFHESLLDGVTWAMPVHKSFGLTVLLLTVLRIGWRLAHPAPALPPTMPGWQHAAAHTTHWGLYTLMLALPVTGWLMVSGGTRPLVYFGLVDVPKLPVDKALSGVGHDAHALLGWLMLLLVVIHVGAALRHHFILRDDVLRRMVPGAGDRA